MLRVYKMPDGRTYRYEDGDQPDCAVLVEKAAEQPETPEKRATKAAARKRTAKKAEEV